MSKELRKNGFKSFGEFAQIVKLNSEHWRNPTYGRTDPRLLRGLTSKESVTTEGGYAVPPAFVSDIAPLIQEESILSLCDTNTTESNNFQQPADESTPWQSSGALQTYWAAEAEQRTEAKVELNLNALYLNKLSCLIPVSEELLEDAPGLSAYLRRKAPANFDFKLTYAFLQGTGAKQPTGILNSGALITVEKASGQAVDTVGTARVSSLTACLLASYSLCSKTK